LICDESASPRSKKIARIVEQLRQSNRQLDLVTISFDELIARIDQDLREQAKNRLHLGSK
jgi:hypothetical protein